MNELISAAGVIPVIVFLCLFGIFALADIFEVVPWIKKKLPVSADADRVVFMDVIVFVFLLAVFLAGGAFKTFGIPQIILLGYLTYITFSTFKKLRKILPVFRMTIVFSALSVVLYFTGFFNSLLC